jgi:hypothetical protein
VMMVLKQMAGSCRSGGGWLLLPSSVAKRGKMQVGY